MLGKMEKSKCTCSENIQSLMEEMKEMRKAMNFMNDRFECTMKELVETKKEKKELQEALMTTQERVTLLEVQMREINNQSLFKNLEVAGIPCNTQENCELIALSVAKSVCQDVNQDDIEDAHRIGNPKDADGKPRSYRPLLIKFKETKIRNKVFKNKKFLKDLDTTKMGISKKKEKLYINENLCRETKAIFREANAARRQHGWKHLWTNRGIILARKDDNSKVLIIRSREDLSHLK